MSIKIKHKKCKGTGKALGEGCGEMALFRKWGLCRGCLSNFYMNTPKGKEMLLKATKKVTAPRKSLEKAIEKEKQTKGIQAAFKVTKVVVHEYIRLRDEGKPCISCNAQWKDDFHAGHCYASGDYFSIRYDFDNIHGQCVYCNIELRGNESNYHLNLPKRIGSKRYKALVQRAMNDKKQPKHWIKDELKEIRKEAKRLTNKLKK